MTNYDDAPHFNLKVVVNETGVKPDTLRAWERRYGLPEPTRTDGGHRLYSQYDIDTIKWLLARQNEGLSISRAVKLWQTIKSESREPLAEMGFGETPSEFKLPDQPPSSTIKELRQAWVDACLDFDEARAEQILSQAFALYSPIIGCIELLQKGLAHIGELWYNDKASVQQEHFASALALRRINSLLAAAPPPTRNGRVLIGCPPHEDHTFPPLMLTLMLKYRGWNVLYLGANVPLARFKSTIESTAPHLIILTAQTLHTAATLATIAFDIKDENVPLAFGGGVFNKIPELKTRIPGHFLGNDFHAALEFAERALTSPLNTPEVEEIPEIYHEALQNFRQEQAMIEAEVWRQLQGKGLAYEHFVNANIHLARDIIASLTFGQLKFIEAELAWVEKLLLNYKMPASLLKIYLQAYSQVASNHLKDKPAELIVSWLQNTSRAV